VKVTQIVILLAIRAASAVVTSKFPVQDRTFVIAAKNTQTRYAEVIAHHAIAFLRKDHSHVHVKTVMKNGVTHGPVFGVLIAYGHRHFRHQSEIPEVPDRVIL